MAWSADDAIHNAIRNQHQRYLYSFGTLRSGVKVPAFAFGSGTALYGQDATSQVVQALQTGFKHLDAAQFYSNEKSVGEGLAIYLSSTSQDRSSVFVTTKFGKKDPGQTAKDVLKTELANLKLDYVDLYLIHTPVAFEGKLGTLWKEFEELKKEGLAKEIGISNFRVGDLEELLGSIESNGGEVPAIHQIEFHPYLLKYNLPILEIHKKYGITLASYGGQTPVTKKDGPVTAELQRIAGALEIETGKKVTPGQVLLKWLDAKEAIIVTTSSKKARLEEYLAAADLPVLAPEDVKAIDAAGMKQHFRGFMHHMDRPRG